jgi:hypothetical protein
MKQSRPFCEKCTKPMTFALRPGAKGRRSWQCFDCEGPDPLTLPDVAGWVKGMAPKRVHSSPEIIIDRRVSTSIAFYSQATEFYEERDSPMRR